MPRLRGRKEEGAGGTVVRFPAPADPDVARGWGHSPDGSGRAPGRPSGRKARWALRIVALALAAAGGWASAGWTVGEIRVSGAASVPPDEIVRASGLEGGERLLLTRLSAAAERVEALPRVRSASVGRGLPDAVVIEVVERRPVARLDAVPELAVDADGVVFAVGAQTPVPLVEGWDGEAVSGGSVDKGTRSMLAAFAGFPDGLRDRVGRITAGDRMTLHLHDGTQVRFGRPVDLSVKAVAAAAVLNAAGGERALAYVDVRVPTAPVVRERDEGEGSPGDAPSPDPA